MYVSKFYNTEVYLKWHIRFLMIASLAALVLMNAL